MNEQPKIHELWKRKRDGREAVIKGSFNNVIEYRYLYAQPTAKRTGQLSPRTNATFMGLSRFLAQFEKVKNAE